MPIQEYKIPFNAPLCDGDTEDQTFGCRQTAPDICRNNGIPGRCAFIAADHICHAPSRAWKKQYHKLKEQAASSD